MIPSLFSKRLFPINLQPKLKPRQIWVMRMSPARPTKDDIIVMVLKVGENKIFCAEKTNYGFTDLAPKSYSIKDFLNTFELLEDASETEG